MPAMQDGGLRGLVMKRRKFLGMILGAGVTFATGAWRTVERAVPARVLTALRGRRYPGPVSTLSDEEIKRPGRWAG
jgi:hypothetical protein